MLEGVVGVVLGLDRGELPVGVIAVRLSNAAGVIVGIEEVDVDAPCAMRLRASRNRRAQAVSRSALAGLVREPHGVDDDVVGYVTSLVGGGLGGTPATAPPMWNIAVYDRGELAA